MTAPVRRPDPRDDIGTRQFALGKALRMRLPDLPPAHEVIGYGDDWEYGALLDKYSERTRVVELAESTLPFAVQVSRDGNVTLAVDRIKWYFPDQGPSGRVRSATEEAMQWYFFDTVEDGLKQSGLTSELMTSRAKDYKPGSPMAFLAYYSRSSGVSLPVKGAITVTDNNSNFKASLSIDSFLDPFPELTTAIFPSRLLDQPSHTLDRVQLLMPDATPNLCLPANLQRIYVHTTDRYGGHWSIDCNGLLSTPK